VGQFTAPLTEQDVFDDQQQEEEDRNAGDEQNDDR